MTDKELIKLLYLKLALRRKLATRVAEAIMKLFPAGTECPEEILFLMTLELSVGKHEDEAKIPELVSASLGIDVPVGTKVDNN